MLAQRSGGQAMTAKPKDLQAAGALAPSTPGKVFELTIATNRIAAGAPDVNPYGVRNDLLTRKEKARVRYNNGVTLPTSAEQLLANAERRDYNHRRTLSRNIVKATTQSRPASTCAHHIVALRDPEATNSRALLFGWGIGINDADNGVFLPQSSTGLPGYPNAPRHNPHHRVAYHLAVYDELQYAGNTQQGRATLRFLKTKILSGALPL
ncbi:AHH domain-containing protein [Rhodanobacter sp. 7MK24]|uniref:AHH domain-containing protein n=1 Tax=Rhodanobacter sp. 7MK24 TaxID=2775922 RepID=UPI0017871E70|nr:AHH domain-containing protein [Rhodanobacter sp. 7MK24]